MKIIRPIILFVVGFCVYITIEVCYRGYSYPLMGICGGTILLLIDCINQKLSWDIDLLLQGCCGSIIATFFEFVIGTICLANGYERMWDYSSLPFNYNGIICLPFSLVWILISILGIFISDAINYYVFAMAPTPYYRLFGKIVLRFKPRTFDISDK